MSPMQSDNFEFANLDILRATAVLMVVGAHYLIWVHDNPVFLGILEPGLLGTMGVVLFFVHTSLVLMMSLDRMAQSGGVNGGMIRAFFVRRFFRVYPLSVAVVLLYYFGGLPAGSSGVVRLDNVQLAANLFLVQNFLRDAEILGPLWSLPYEIQMYLMLPFIWLAIRKLTSPLAVIAFWVFLLFMATVLHDKIGRLSDDLEYFAIPLFLKWMPCFVPGIFAYVIIRNRPVQILPYWTFWAVMMFSAIGYMITYNMEKTILVAGMIGITLPYLRPCTTKPLIAVCKTVAKYSYGIYLFHILGITIGFKSGIFDNYAIQFTVFCSITFGLPYVLFHVLENPMIAFGKKISSLSKNRSRLA